MHVHSGLAPIICTFKPVIFLAGYPLQSWNRIRGNIKKPVRAVTPVSHPAERILFIQLKLISSPPTEG